MKFLKLSTVLFATMFCFSFSVFAQNNTAQSSSSNTKSSVFMKIEGLGGSAAADANHDKWIDVLSIDWGSNKPTATAAGQSRRRGDTILGDVIMTIEYDKSTPKLQEACANGKVFPEVEIHMTSNYGGARATYLRYELKNVQITSVQTNARGARIPMAKVAMTYNAKRVLR